jgi:glycosyltransferase involved in cell wall biosynthesis
MQTTDKTNKINHICLCLGRVKTRNEGLGEFAYQLITELLARSDSLRKQHGIKLHLYASENWKDSFADQLDFHPYSRLHRYWHPSEIKFSIWHSLHQLNRVKPASGTKTSLLTVHDLNYLHVESQEEIEKRTKKLKRILSQTKYAVAISEFSRQDLVQQCGWAGSCEVIYNGTTNLSNSTMQPVDELKNTEFFFHVSRMAPNKNVESLLKLAASWEDKRFVLAGASGKDTFRLQQMANELKLKNVYFFLNINDAQKAWLYAHCKAFLFPSLAEGFGLPPIEAMHFGKPVFASNRTSLPEVCGNFAFYWHSFAAKEMRQVIQTGLETYDQKNLSDQIKLYASNFSWKTCAEKYINLYSTLLANQIN